MLETSHWSLGFYKVQRCFLGDLRSCRTRVVLKEAGLLQGTEMSHLRIGTCRRSVVLSSVLEIRSDQAAALYGMPHVTL